MATEDIDNNLHNMGLHMLKVNIELPVYISEYVYFCMVTQRKKVKKENIYNNISILINKLLMYSFN